MPTRKAAMWLLVLASAAILIHRGWESTRPALANDPVPQSDLANQSPTLDQLCSGKLPIVDLTWPLNENNRYWPGDDYEPFRLKTIATTSSTPPAATAWKTSRGSSNSPRADST